MKNILVVLFLVVAQHGTSVISQKLHLGVYYSSKCIDSVNFIKKQLAPAVDLLQNYLVLTMVPFGKAHSVNNGKNGFFCQHGQLECIGNKVQDCALQAMQWRPDTDKVKYAVCEMTKLASTRNSLQCVQSLGLPEQAVRRCIDTDEGTQLQLKSERATNRYKPRFIPTITINNVFNEQTQKLALKNLIDALCSYMRNVPPCVAHYNRQALRFLFIER